MKYLFMSFLSIITEYYFYLCWSLKTWKKQKLKFFVSHLASLTSFALIFSVIVFHFKDNIHLLVELFLEIGNMFDSPWCVFD